MDDPFVSCPYDMKHRVPRSRLQRHLVKCEKNYPPLQICPFNATHRFPKNEIKAHVANCPSKQGLETKDIKIFVPKLGIRLMDDSDEDEDWD